MTNTTAMPHIKRHQEHAFVCPCCGQDDETASKGTHNYGAEVFESASCPKCGQEWQNEWRLYATRHSNTNEVALVESQPLAALLALQSASWLEADPCDTEELASAKRQALEAIEKAQKPN